MSELPELIQALLDPAAYPAPTKGIKLTQTQMSFVFLAGDYVYKVKKPVNLGYLDYTTLKKRRFFCRQEVTLNRRLCPDIYLDVVPIIRHGNHFKIGGKGAALEYAVKMRRLPSEAMMDALLTADKVSTEMLSRVAAKLARFHHDAETSTGISAFGDLDNIRKNNKENFTQTEKYIDVTIPHKRYEQLRDYTGNFIERNASLFHRRVAEGRIRDCHGDLHAAHICFTDGICIYDCIEFNDRFRYCDVASEVAFLAMDLDHYGRADLSHDFVNAYVTESRDKELEELLHFYKCYRACVRGKVASFKYDDPYVTGDEKMQTRQIAGSYFDLAGAYARPKPILFITTGLVGTGKSVLARALAKRLGLVVISSDVTRKHLANIPATERRFEGFHSGIYSPEFSRKTYDKIFSEAKNALSGGASVILDASFIRSAERLRARSLAGESGADFFIIECTLDEGSIKQRLEQRLEEESVSDGRREILEPQKQQFEPVKEVPAARHIIIDTSVPTEEIVQQVIDRIF